MAHNSEGAGYFLYHSIGLFPGKEEAMAAALSEFAQVWSAPNDAQWGHVMGKRAAFIDGWSRLIGAPPGTVTTCETVTDGLRAILRALPEGMLRGKRVIVAADCFPSLHFLLAGLAPRMGFALHTVPLSEGVPWVETGDFIDAWGPDVGLALLTHVTSVSSSRMDHAALVAHGRAMGSLIAVDITQSAGLLPFDVTAPRVDFVISTSLKWLCGAPGAGIIHVTPDLIPELTPETRGWFSQPNPFSWDLDSFDYAPDIRRFDTGTPPSVSALASIPGIEWTLAQDRGALLAHNAALVERIMACADTLGLPLHSPREAGRRGGAAMVRLKDAEAAAALVAALRADGFSMDARGPVLRMAPGIVTQESAVDAAFERIAHHLRAAA